MRVLCGLEIIYILVGTGLLKKLKIMHGSAGGGVKMDKKDVEKELLQLNKKLLDSLANLAKEYEVMNKQWYKMCRHQSNRWFGFLVIMTISFACTLIVLSRGLIP